MIIARPYAKWKQIPVQVRLFILKALLLLVLWKTIYLLFLLPGRILDGPLTAFVGITTTKVLNFGSNTKPFSYHYVLDQFPVDGKLVSEPSVAIVADNKRVITIADACNGLELFVLYACFIIALPTNRKREISFIVGGLAIICFVNILRCAGLSYIFIRYPQYGDFSHHFLFKFIVYALIFCLWVWYSKKLINERPS